MIHEEIVTFEVAKLAKEKNFPLQKVIKQDGRAFFYELPQSHPDWPNCDAWYLPTQSLLQRWLREEKYLFVDIGMAFNGYYYQIVRTDKFEECIGTQISERFNFNKFDTYELALEDALKYALENLV